MTRRPCTRCSRTTAPASGSTDSTTRIGRPGERSSARPSCFGRSAMTSRSSTAIRSRSGELGRRLGRKVNRAATTWPRRSRGSGRGASCLSRQIDAVASWLDHARSPLDHRRWLPCGRRGRQRDRGAACCPPPARLSSSRCRRFATRAMGSGACSCGNLAAASPATRTSSCPLRETTATLGSSSWSRRSTPPCRARTRSAR